MKQKIILLLVLIAGLTACTKDDDDVSNNYSEAYKNAKNASDNFSIFGEYESNWMYNYGGFVGGYKVIVTEKEIQATFPENELLEFARYFCGEYGKIFFGGKFEQQPITHTFHYEKVGISDYLLYHNLYYDDLPQYSEKGEGFVVVKGEAETFIDNERCKVNYGFLSDEPGILIYNMKEKFWIIIIQLNKLFIEYGEEKTIIDLRTYATDNYTTERLKLISQAFKKID